MTSKSQSRQSSSASTTKSHTGFILRPFVVFIVTKSTSNKVIFDILFSNFKFINLVFDLFGLIDFTNHI